MDFDSLKNKAKELLGQHDDKVDQAFDKVGEQAKARFAGHEDQIDDLTQKAKDHDFSGGARPPEPRAAAPTEPPPAE